MTRTASGQKDLLCFAEFWIYGYCIYYLFSLFPSFHLLCLYQLKHISILIYMPLEWYFTFGAFPCKVIWGQMCPKSTIVDVCQTILAKQMVIAKSTRGHKAGCRCLLTLCKHNRSMLVLWCANRAQKSKSEAGNNANTQQTETYGAVQFGKSGRKKTSLYLKGLSFPDAWLVCPERICENGFS